MKAEGRILVVSPLAPSTLGGIERYLEELVRGWPEGEMVLLSPDPPAGSSPLPCPRITIPPYGPSIPGRLKAQAFALWKTLGVLRGGRPRLLLYPQLVYAWQGSLLKRLFGIPYAVIAYGVELTAGHGLGFKRRSLGRADLVFSDSRDTQALLRRLGVDCPVTVAYPGVHAARFQGEGPARRAEALRREWKLEGRRVLLTVARLAGIDRYKGHDAILEALSRLKDRFPDLAYLIVGDGDDRPRLEALAASLGVADRTVFAGRVSEGDLPACYALSELFVMPSSGEGFGIVYVESQAASRAVLALRRGGAPETLLEGETGVLVETGEAGELARVLAALLADPGRLRAMGERGAAWVGERFSWEGTVRSARQGVRDLERPAVLFLSPVGGFLGGAERCLLDLAGSLDRSRFRPLLACPEDGPLVGRARDLGAEAFVLGLPPWVLRIGREAHPLNALLLPPALAVQLAYGLRVGLWTRRHRVALVHANGNKAQLWSLGVRLLAGRSVRLVWHLHDFPRGISGRILRILAGSADAVIANSRSVAEAFADSPGLASNTRVIHNGVDLTRFSPEGPVADLGLPPGTPLVGMVGILAPWKGHEVFLRAARRVLSRRVDAVFLIVGAEAYRTHGHDGWHGHLERLAEELGIRASVRFLGEREDMPEILRALDLLVHASVRPEPFGRVLAEALACGKPVVAARAGGVPEIVDEGRTGLLVAPGDDEALAAAILDLLGDPVRRQAMGTAGAGRMRKDFAIPAITARAKALYDELLKGGAR